jgi:hypothetical protein
MGDLLIYARNVYIIVGLEQELAQVAQLESALRDAGLPEYEVQREAQNLQDELIARRCTAAISLCLYCFSVNFLLFTETCS